MPFSTDSLALKNKCENQKLWRCKMHITLPLEQMSTEEKIQAMETIWDNLCKKANSLSSPAWHKNVLLEREEKLKKGDEKFVDWDKAQKDIRNKIS